MSDSTTPHDDAAMSPASDGSVAGGGGQQLRDTFAAAALTGLLSSLPNGDQYHSFAVEKAWSLADAMLCEREPRRCPVSSQENLTLTDAEREAVEQCAKDYEDSAALCRERGHDGEAVKRMKRAMVLGVLLERLGGGK